MTVEMKAFLKVLRKAGACGTAIRFCRKFATAQEAYVEFPKGDPDYVGTFWACRLYRIIEGDGQNQHQGDCTCYGNPADDDTVETFDDFLRLYPKVTWDGEGFHMPRAKARRRKVVKS